MLKPRHFRCDCGWSFHSLCIDPLDDDFPVIAITVINAPWDFNWRERIRAAWAVLRGNEHIFSEVIINREDVGEFAEYVTDLAELCQAAPMPGQP